ncbi:hypothetical protein [Paenibacillus hexagrammi]|uniref:Post-SET domain-containing protein n=1 Tax=Paenibacillus hexagrammi TaxID=2908839 RepID=A0ABY3SGK4_9BACL|nr:hypothetical protein [Paenibacillus sp. YPD9-1]UJF32319.1 hypothetical protein L0M14_21795 [Paenibacillus sp. YPD9-1]
MFELITDHWSFDKDLQIIHADVKLSIQQDSVVEEPLCVDVGLPALLFSALHDTDPNRFAPADQWQRMPFFVCGCGDPECRGFSFVVRHKSADQLELTNVEERPDGTYRELDSYLLDAHEYLRQVLQVGEAFLEFIQGLDYRPYFSDTVAVVSDLVGQLQQQVRSV